MKIFMIECTEDELRANRGLIDVIVDAASGLLNTLYGNYTPTVSDTEDETQESEETLREKLEGEERGLG